MSLALIPRFPKHSKVLFWPLELLSIDAYSSGIMLKLNSSLLLPLIVFFLTGCGDGTSVKVGGRTPNGGFTATNNPTSSPGSTSASAKTGGNGVSPGSSVSVDARKKLTIAPSVTELSIECSGRAEISYHGENDSFEDSCSEQSLLLVVDGGGSLGVNPLDQIPVTVEGR